MKKKILFIMYSLEGGGAEKALCTLLQHFNYERYEVDLCLVVNSGAFLAEVPEDVNVIPFYKQPRSLISKIENRLYMHFGLFIHSSRIKRKVKKQYNTIISFMEGKPLRLHSYIHKRAQNNVSWVHTDMLLNTYTTHKAIFNSAKDEIKAYSVMNKLVFVSNQAMEQFRKKYTINAEHQVIYNPIDKEDIINRSVGFVGISKRKFTICSVGSLLEIKAFDRILRVAKRLKVNNYDLDFWIIGKGKLKDDLVYQTKELGLEDCIHFLGFHTPPYVLMKAADLFLVVSKVEGFPIALCEAFCVGLPVVATKCTGITELLDNNKYGILTEHDDESIYYALKEMIDNKNKLEHYKKMAIQRTELFNIHKTMKEVYQVID